ncbi:HAD-IIB family hydrolase [Vreelandella salicampi]|uniref:HAD-IIB family hydrolase n=1 Tax=Vreelandella salicampi TaxID=1449798 RepID=A0A7Z0LN66_9GAMM|nr:HAD-IIB family hydrolase [Halomonas salicampi]NYS62069.1 HAD-IIB family hydrolase [Halomonas salicampi]
MPLADNLTSIRYLLTDVDDTLTTDGRLLPETLAALYRLEDAGIDVIPVTGGCAGWCDQMIRLWPVPAVIGENGAFYFVRDPTGKVEFHSWDTPEAGLASRQRLLNIAEVAMACVPALRLAKDQPYRLSDVALDHGQDVSGVSAEDIDRALATFREAGANARASSIHINAWFGDYSKQAMAQRLLQQKYGLTEPNIQQYVAFVGDSPNDESMFAYLTHTFGVANIGRWLDRMTHHPRYLLAQRGGIGFSELATLLLRAQRRESKADIGGNDGRSILANGKGP